MRLDGQGALTMNGLWCVGFLDSRLRGNDGWGEGMDAVGWARDPNREGPLVRGFSGFPAARE